MTSEWSDCMDRMANAGHAA